MKIVQWIKTHRYCLAGLYLFVFLAGFFMLQKHEVHAMQAWPGQARP